MMEWKELREHMTALSESIDCWQKDEFTYIKSNSEKIPNILATLELVLLQLEHGNLAGFIQSIKNSDGLQQSAQNRPSDSTESKHLKLENEQLTAENTLLKSLLLDGRDVNEDSKAEAEPSSGSCQPLMQSEPPAQGSVHLRARRAQAIDQHKAMRQQISESSNILKDLIPDSNKGQGSVLLDEIFKYIQSLQHQIELQFLSMELAALNQKTNPTVEAFRQDVSEEEH